MPDLSKGDFVYQSDQELFLVVTGESEDSYHFAVHGWRTIDKNRLDEYVSHDNGKLYKQGDISDVVDSDGDDAAKEHFEQMKTMFEVYEQKELTEDGPHTDFTLEDN